MLEVLAFVAVTAVTAGVIIKMMEGLLNLWGYPQEMPEHVQVEMSEHDEGMILETKNLLEEFFGESAVEALRNMSNKERVDLMTDFAEKLARRYGLDIKVDITVSNAANCGHYSWQNKKAEFNIIMLMVDGNDKNFEYCVRETLDTIIHELRHAVQHRAILEEGFWNVEEDRRTLWAENMLPGNYIRPDVDLQGYVKQPIEADAATFAAQAMKGVH